MELFDTAPEPKPSIPTVPQMRFLHVLSGARLTVRNKPSTFYEWHDLDGNFFFYRFHPTVFTNVVLHGWAKMQAFSTSQAVYTLSTEGREAIKELCQHSHPFIDDSTEILGGTLVCKSCGRALRCRSKQPTVHPANRIHWRFGAICHKCWEYLTSKA